MERKALAIVIVLLSLLAILALVYINQPATAPPLSPGAKATSGPPVVSPSAMVSLPENTSSPQNATITPTPWPRSDARAPARHATATPTAAPVAQAPPTPTPFGPMAPWSPMAPMQPMAPATPLSWNDKLTR